MCCEHFPHLSRGTRAAHTDMRTRRLLSITLLGLLLWVSCLQANDSSDSTDDHTEKQGDTSQEASEEIPGDSEETEETPKKEKTTEIEEEKDVMVLHINNFDRALSENKYLLVEFCKCYNSNNCIVFLINRSLL